MNKISRLWALVITISILALGAVVANSNSPSSAEGGCAGQAYVTDIKGTAVSVINTSTNTLSTTITVGTSPFGVAMTPDGTKAYVTNYIDDTVSVINTATGLVSATITVGNDPAGVAITPNGAFAYVANGGDGTVSVINTATNAVITTIPLAVGSGPQGVAICPGTVAPPVTPTDPAVVLKFTG